MSRLKTAGNSAVVAAMVSLVVLKAVVVSAMYFSSISASASAVTGGLVSLFQNTNDGSGVARRKLCASRATVEAVALTSERARLAPALNLSARSSTVCSNRKRNCDFRGRRRGARRVLNPRRTTRSQPPYDAEADAACAAFSPARCFSAAKLNAAASPGKSAIASTSRSALVAKSWPNSLIAYAPGFATP